MQDKKLLQLALGLSAPWIVKDVKLDLDDKKLDIYIDFERGGRFDCPQCPGNSQPAYDTKERTWKHLNFFQYETLLHARVPRIQCPKCGVKTASVPWARPGSGFTLLFEALALHLAQQMPVAPVAKELRVHPDSIWRILMHYVEEARSKLDVSSVKAVGIDECSKQKGHEYITTFCDLETSRVIYVAEGRHKEVLSEFASDFTAHDGDLEEIDQVCCDMWPAYISGVHENLPNAQITFDRYHVMSMMNRAVDLVRRAEAKEQPELLKRSRYLWLKNPGNLSAPQSERIKDLKTLDLKTARAYHIKLALQRLWDFRYPKAAARYLKKWYYWATHSRLEPIVEFAKTVKRHWDGILNYTESRITNGIVEGINSKIKTALKRAYGFKNFQYYRTIIYLVAGKLDLPTRSC